MEKNYCVYCHTSPSNKKYIGISKDPIKRWNNGKGYIKNYLFYRAIKKYGWDNFKHEILYTNLTVDEAGKIEKKLINEWNLTNPNFGYNLREGGNGKFSDYSRYLMSKSRLKNKNCLGHSLSQETKDKISQSLKEYYKTHENHNKNRTISEETKEKMRKNHANVKGVNNPSAKAIKQYDLNGNFIAEYSYAKVAAIKYNIDLYSIIKCCRGKQKTCGGYKWSYINI